MKKLFFTAAAALCILASCTRVADPETLPNEEKLVAVTFEASAEEDAATKSFLSGNKIYWEAGESVAVFDGVSASPRVFTVVEVSGSSARIAGEVSASASGPFYAVYPYSASASLQGGAINAALPSVQTLGAHEVAPGALACVANASSLTSKFQFKNVFSLAKITITESGINGISLYSNNKEPLSGQATFTIFGGVTPSEAAIDRVKLLPSGDSFAPGTYYISVFPGTVESGLAVVLDRSDAKALKKGSSQAVFARNGGVNLGTVSGLSWVPYNITTAAQLRNWAPLAPYYESDDTVTLGADISMGGSWACASRFSGVFDGAGHKIKSLTTSVSLVDTLSSGAVLRDVVLDSSCSLSFPASIDNFGFLVSNCYGTVNGLVNNANVTLPSFTGGRASAIVGKGYAGCTVEDCVNNGNISFNGTRAVNQTLYLGGVAGSVTSTPSSVSHVLGCSNNGKITFRITSDSSSNSWHIGGVAGSFESVTAASECHNTGNIFYTTTGNTGKILLGGIVSYCNGSVSLCTNSGSVTVASESSDGAADGAIKSVGVAGISCYQASPIDHCTNSGAILLRAGYYNGQMQVGSMTKYATAAAGIVAYAYEGGTVSDCTNTGSVESSIRRLDQCADAGFNTSSRHSVAGIIGSTYGDVTSCRNEGTVKAVWTTASHSATLAKNFVAMAGGIAGGDYNSTQIATDILNCTNTGTVDICCDSSGSNSAFGGIVGWPGKETAAGENSVTGCVNTGSVLLSGYSKSRLGGVSGGATRMEGCRNSGAVRLASGLTSCSVGGVIGFHNFFSVTGCRNEGDITTDVVLAGSASSNVFGGIGGLFGGIGNTTVNVSGGSVSCRVSAPSSCQSASMLIGIIGHDKSSTVALNVGIPDTPIVLSGSFNSTALTASNYTNYIKSANYQGLDPNVAFNIRFSAGSDNAGGGGEGFGGGGTGTW
ncbi:MAG: hypothetical protein IJS66_00880 [Bacteroidales bacterium]|nr:hypothetical protein [Bacteroidales bacterium]